MKSYLIALILSLTPLLAYAGSKLPPCTPEMAAGTKCIYKIEDLRPTQSEVGQYQIDKKVKQFKKLSPSQIETLLEKKIVPVVIGPDGNLYLIDHHHTSLALFDVGQKDAHIVVKENWLKMEPNKAMPDRMKAFWERLDEKQFCFLKKADGTWIDPLSRSFPKTLAQCGDNPYRSLVWILSQDGALKEGVIPYYEFYISEVLKKKGLVIPRGELKKKDIKRYLKEAKRILKEEDVQKFVRTVVKEGASCDVHALLRVFLK